MFRSTPIFFAAVLTALTSPMAIAGAEDDLRACYAQVIRSCDAAARPGLCSDAGMQSCDEMHFAGVTLSPEVIGMISRDSLGMFLPLETPAIDLSEVTPMPMPVMPPPVPAPAPTPAPEETAEVEEEDGLDPEIEAALRLIEILAGL